MKPLTVRKFIALQQRAHPDMHVIVLLPDNMEADVTHGDTDLIGNLYLEVSPLRKIEPAWEAPEAGDTH